jgi:hypothetical protein
MPHRSLRRSVAVAALALLSIPVAASAAQTKPVPATVGAHLRVLDPSQSISATEATVYSSSTNLPTSKHATCFGPGTGGSGHSIALKGATALGLVQSASKEIDGLRLAVTDHFDFGPGLCGIGSSVASGDEFWDLIVNHTASQVGGAQKIHGGDDVLWYLAPSYPPGPELQLKAPAAVPGPGDYQATVYQFDSETGARSPAPGVTVDFASQPTDAQGHTTMTFGQSGTAGVGATRPSDDAIPDAGVVCVGTDNPCGAFNDIYGSARDDQIKGTGQSDFIDAGKGDDKINLRGGGSDIVNCGAGKDKVVVQKGDHDDKIRATCEKVVKG